MAEEGADRLRGLLGDTLVDGAEPFFSDAQIDAMLIQHSGRVSAAAHEGWMMKAAAYADLITVTEGNASRQMSDLQDHAMKMVKHYEGISSDFTAGRTRIGRIRRFI